METPIDQRGTSSGLQSVSGACVVAAKDIFVHALDATRVSHAMKQQISCNTGILQISDRRCELGSYERLILVAIGKAAVPMTTTFLRIVGDEGARFEGVVAGVPGEALPERLHFFPGGHPSPTQASLDAAAGILRVLEGVSEHDLVIFLMSGGGSSMVEQLLPTGVSLPEIAATHKALVESGAPIASINAIRKHLSAVKGGRLAAAANPAEQVTLFVSDVPAGALDALASGPTLPDSSTNADVGRILAEFELLLHLPPGVAEFLTADALPETPKPGEAMFERSLWTVLLDSSSLEQAAAARATELGWDVTIDSSCDDWTAEAAARHLLQRLEELKAAAPKRPVCLISAGEVTVRVPSNATGKGGRNQHFALLCAQQIAGRDYVVLSAGSDGIDGNSSAAGAVVDGTTCARAAALGYSIEQTVAAFDSYTLLSQLGEALVIGPTGNNLRDLRILLAP